MSCTHVGDVLGPRLSVASPQYLNSRCVGRSLLSGWVLVGGAEAPSVPVGNELVARWFGVGSALECCQQTVFVLVISWVFAADLFGFSWESKSSKLTGWK